MKKPKMCEYCKLAEDLDGTLIEDHETRLMETDTIGVNVAATVMRDNIMVDVTYIGSEEDSPFNYGDLKLVNIDINFCPMCGRRLREKLLPFKEVANE